MPSTEPSKKTSPWVIIAIVVGVLLFVVVAFVGVLAALGIFGARKYVQQAKTAEANAEVRLLAEGIVLCAAGGSGLPDSAPPVPASLSDVQGKKYMSSPAEWSNSTYTCAHFSMSVPSYFQYEWQKLGSDSGKAIARGDLDGDGSAETVVEIEITCSPTCHAGPPSTVGR